MFDFSFAEIAIVVVVALLVLKPEDIPELLFRLKQLLRKVMSIVHEFTAVVDDIKDLRDEELNLHALQEESPQQETLDEPTLTEAVADEKADASQVNHDSGRK